MLSTELRYEIEETKDGYSILKMYRENRPIYVGSKYNMQREIKKFLSSFENYKNKRDVFIVYGFGTGEHIKALRNKYSNRIIVFEPNRKLLLQYINKLDWPNNDKNLKVISCEENQFMITIKNEINEFNFKNSEYIVFSNYDKIYETESKLFFKILNNYIVSLGLDVNTKLAFSKKWFENLIKIIPYVVKGMPADIYNNKYKDKPAVIVSAGPSLIKNIDLLKGVNDNMLIISGGRTLRTLTEKDIKFHLLAIADTTDLNYKLVEDYIDKVNVPLLFSEGANTDIVKQHKGNKLFYSYNDFIYKIVGRKMSHISTAGSVAHAMTSYAINLGCNPIIFIGQDFAYTEEKHYSSLTEDKYSSEEDRNKDYIWVDDINGNKVRTDYALNDQRSGMEKIISLYPKVKFINATEGGARIKGTVEMSLEKAISRYNGKAFGKFEEINYNVDIKANAIKELNEVKKIGTEIYKLCSMQIEKSEEISTVDQEIIKLYTKNGLYNYLLYPLVYEYYRTDKSKSANTNEKEVVKIKKLYLNIINELKFALEIIENQIRML